MTTPDDYEIIPSSAIPNAPEHSRGRERYPWHKLNVGDCFFSSDRNIHQMCSAVAQCYPRRNWKWKYTCWTGEKNGVKGVWVKRLPNDESIPRAPFWPNTAEEAIAKLDKGKRNALVATKIKPAEPVQITEPKRLDP